jgi:hypothetical protein
MSEPTPEIRLDASDELTSEAAPVRPALAARRVEPTAEARRAASREIQDEIRGLLRLVAEEAGSRPLYHVEYGHDAPTHEQQQAIAEAIAEAIQTMQANAGNYLTLPVGVTANHAYHPYWLRRLCWLLGLSDAERSFVSDIADAALEGRPADAYGSLMVFADWLEDNVRTEEGEAIRKLTPRDGDVLLMKHPVGVSTNPEAMKKAKDFFSLLRSRLAEAGREVTMLLLPEGWSLNSLSTHTLEEFGLTSKRKLDAANESNLYLIEKVTRLERENAELRAELEKEREAFRAYRTDFD